MAGCYYRRSLVFAALSLATLTVTVTCTSGASATATTITSHGANFSVVQTTCSTDYDYQTNAGVVVISFSYASHDRALDLRPIAEPAALDREYPGHPIAAIKPSRFGHAVRPSSVAGWRSGRVRRLAAA